MSSVRRGSDFFAFELSLANLNKHMLDFLLFFMCTLVFPYKRSGAQLKKDRFLSLAEFSLESVSVTPKAYEFLFFWMKVSSSRCAKSFPY